MIAVQNAPKPEGIPESGLPPGDTGGPVRCRSAGGRVWVIAVAEITTKTPTGWGCCVAGRVGDGPSLPDPKRISADSAGDRTLESDIGHRLYRLCRLSGRRQSLRISAGPNGRYHQRNAAFAPNQLNQTYQCRRVTQDSPRSKTTCQGRSF